MMEDSVFHVMTTTSFVVLSVLIGQFMVTTANETLVEMDSTSTECGKVFLLGPSKEVKVASQGQAPGGYCGVSIYVPQEVDNYTCDAICVTFRTASIFTCDVKIKFVGHMFRKEGDLVKTYDCHHKSKDSFCWAVNSMRLEVIESYSYAYEWKRGLYDFELDMSTRCSKNNDIARSVHHTSKEEFEKQEMETYIQGVAVGVSFAIIFLIVLLITWCYTRHKPIDHRRRAGDEPSAHKGTIISTFRKMLPTRNGGKSSKEADPQVEYRNSYPKSVGTPETAVVADDPEKGADWTELLNDVKPEADKRLPSCGSSYELAIEPPANYPESEIDPLVDQYGGGDVFLNQPEVVICPSTPEPLDDVTYDYTSA